MILERRGETLLLVSTKPGIATASRPHRCEKLHAAETTAVSHCDSLQVEDEGSTSFFFLSFFFIVIIRNWLRDFRESFDFFRENANFPCVTWTIFEVTDPKI